MSFRHLGIDRETAASLLWSSYIGNAFIYLFIYLCPGQDFAKTGCLSYFGFSQGNFCSVRLSDLDQLSSQGLLMWHKGHGKPEDLVEYVLRLCVCRDLVPFLESPSTKLLPHASSQTALWRVCLFFEPRSVLLLFKG